MAARANKPQERSIVRCIDTEPPSPAQIAAHGRALELLAARLEAALPDRLLSGDDAASYRASRTETCSMFVA